MVVQTTAERSLILVRTINKLDGPLSLHLISKKHHDAASRKVQNSVPLNHQPKEHGPFTQFVWTTIAILLDQVGVTSGTHFVFITGNHFVYSNN
ncbi:hypothetical protein [Alteromonas sp. ASW11-130]|uniref:hypothetical protein n=1 Tax=Alteromonas sp. ASW11-130 TaxID=3015775 RepID=UPI002241E760|nr:hypothetical protein [Alteromonas sp. ASW11-130]MCW8090563.1 hypothetical protein [Alteromonas sp. ASW11-130]